MTQEQAQLVREKPGGQCDQGELSEIKWWRRNQKGTEAGSLGTWPAMEESRILFQMK